jgi:hypothetical protein
VSTATPAGNAHTVEPDAAALAVLRGLYAPLRGGAALEPTCVVVQPDEIPQPADALLVHHEHMTEVLHRRYGNPVDVTVLDESLDDDRYTRKVTLTLSGGGPVVEWGVVRLNFRYMSDAVRDEILAKRIPLGAILIKHDVHRRIKPRWFMRFPARGPTLTWFGDAGGEALYGRIGTIYCDEQPAIELLEIVTCAKANNEPRSSAAKNV